MVSTLARNERVVASIQAIGAIFPNSISPSTTTHTHTRQKYENGEQKCAKTYIFDIARQRLSILDNVGVS